MKWVIQNFANKNCGIQDLVSDSPRPYRKLETTQPPGAHAHRGTENEPTLFDCCARNLASRDRPVLSRGPGASRSQSLQCLWRQDDDGKWPFDSWMLIRKDGKTPIDLVQPPISAIRSKTCCPRT